MKTKDTEKKRKHQYNRKEAILGYLFASPWLIGFVLLMAFPLCYSLYLSFTNATTTTMNISFKGFDYYKVIIKDPVFWESTWNTLKFVLLSVPLNLLFALYLALFNRYCAFFDQRVYCAAAEFIAKRGKLVFFTVF